MFISSYNQISIGLSATLNLLGILERCRAPLLRNVRSSRASFFFFYTSSVDTRVSSIHLEKEIKTYWEKKRSVYKALCTLTHRSSGWGVGGQIGFHTIVL